MAPLAEFEVLQDTFTARLMAMKERCSGGSIRSYLNRVVYNQYKLAQIARWNSENGTETGTWTPLNEKYALRKLKDCAKYPYSGTKMLIAEGTLFQAVIGDGGSGKQYHRKVVDKNSITIGVSSDLKYARFVNDGTPKMPARPFMEWSKGTKASIIQGMKDFLLRGKQ
jgi:hypothetical protein